MSCNRNHIWIAFDNEIIDDFYKRVVYKPYWKCQKCEKYKVRDNGVLKYPIYLGNIEWYHEYERKQKIPMTRPSDVGIPENNYWSRG